MRDFEAGRIGTRSLMADDAWETESGSEPPELTFQFEVAQSGSTVAQTIRTINIIVPDTAVETMAVLAGLELESMGTEEYIKDYDEEYGW